MEALFEVKTEYREEQLAAFFSKYLRFRKPVLGVYAILTFLWIAEAILYAATYLLLMCAIVLPMAIWLYRRPKSLAKKMIKQELEFADVDRVIATVTFAEEIHSTASRGTSIIPYDKIKSIYHTKYGVILLDVRNRFVPLDKTGFTKGTFEELLPFIQEKCPKAKTYR